MKGLKPKIETRERAPEVVRGREMGNGSGCLWHCLDEGSWNSDQLRNY